MQLSHLHLFLNFEQMSHDTHDIMIDKFVFIYIYIYRRTSLVFNSSI